MQFTLATQDLHSGQGGVCSGYAIDEPLHGWGQAQARVLHTHNQARHPTCTVPIEHLRTCPSGDMVATRVASALYWSRACHRVQGGACSPRGTRGRWAAPSCGASPAAPPSSPQWPARQAQEKQSATDPSSAVAVCSKAGSMASERTALMLYLDSALVGCGCVRCTCSDDGTDVPVWCHRLKVGCRRKHRARCKGTEKANSD